MSIKYQVLSDMTAIIGAIKQKNKATGELIMESSVEFGRNETFNLL